MNILFFLKPKSEVAYIYDDFTVRQALEKMEHHRYSAIPVINRNGEYVGTITEGDFLWTLKNKYDMDVKDFERIMVKSIDHHVKNISVGINANIEDLLLTAMNQNFVPVINDDKIFIGIVTRKDIMQYFCKQYFHQMQEE